MVILSLRGMLVRKFMLAAYTLGMTNGDWVFLDVEIFQVFNIMLLLCHQAYIALSTNFITIEFLLG